MKARLVIGVLTCAAMLAILAGVTTPAKADKKGSPNCNNNLNGHWASAAPPTFSPAGNYDNVQLHWTQNCGSGPNSVEAELQISHDGGNHWNDVGELTTSDNIDYLYDTPSSQANVTWHRTAAVGQIVCDGSATYRTHVYVNQAESKSGPVAC